MKFFFYSLIYLVNTNIGLRAAPCFGRKIQRRSSQYLCFRMIFSSIPSTSISLAISRHTGLPVNGISHLAGDLAPEPWSQFKGVLTDILGFLLKRVLNTSSHRMRWRSPVTFLGGFCSNEISNRYPVQYAKSPQIVVVCCSGRLMHLDDKVPSYYMCYGSYVQLKLEGLFNAL